MTNVASSLLSLPAELFEQITLSLDYFSLKSLAATNRRARKLISKSALRTTLLAIELHDQPEAEILKEKALLPCYACLRVLPNNDLCIRDSVEIDRLSPFACVRLCGDCHYKAGGHLNRLLPTLNRVKAKRMRLLEKRGWVPAGRHQLYRVWEEKRRKRMINGRWSYKS